MTLTELLQIFSACTGVIGALFFAIGIIRQNVPAMAALSGTYWDNNPHMPPALAAQKADYIFGGGIIVLTFGLQLASFVVPPNTQLFPPEHAQAIRWSMVVATAVVFVALRYLAALLGKHYERQVREFLRRQQQAQAASRNHK